MDNSSIKYKCDELKGQINTLCQQLKISNNYYYGQNPSLHDLLKLEEILNSLKLKLELKHKEEELKRKKEEELKEQTRIKNQCDRLKGQIESLSHQHGIPVDNVIFGPPSKEQQLKMEMTLSSLRRSVEDMKRLVPIYNPKGSTSHYKTFDRL